MASADTERHAEPVTQPSYSILIYLNAEQRKALELVREALNGVNSPVSVSQMARDGFAAWAEKFNIEFPE